MFCDSNLNNDYKKKIKKFGLKNEIHISNLLKTKIVFSNQPDEKIVLTVCFCLKKRASCI